MSNFDQLYFDLLKKSLTFALWPEPATRLAYFARKRSAINRIGVATLDWFFGLFNVRLMVEKSYTNAQRDMGEMWPSYAHTMVGMKRMDNLQHCVETVLKENVPGDLIETGVWRGGACILMQAVLTVNGATDRKLFVADSFEGLPPPDPKYPVDSRSWHSQYDFLRVSQEEVQLNFEKYGLFADNVVFIKGFFADTMQTAPIDQLSVLRLDGDMYSSTTEVLDALYPKLAPGGFCIIDDYGLKGCRAAVHDYRDKHGITEEMLVIDNTGRFWRKPKV